MEVFDWSFLAMMAGQSDLERKAFETLRRQVGTVSVGSETIELMGTPQRNGHVEAPGSLSIRPFSAAEGGFAGEALSPLGDYTIDGTTVTITTEGMTKLAVSNGEVMVAYFSLTADCEVITFNADKFPPSYYIVGDFEYREASTGADKWAQLHILNARPQADLSLSLGSEVTTLAVTFDALADGLGDMFHIVKIGGEFSDIEAGGGGRIGSSMGFGGTQDEVGYPGN